MSVPESLPPLEPQPQPQQRARKRRARRAFFPSDAEGQDAMLADLARRAYPSYELYLFALICGAILSAGYFLDAPALLFFGVLSAPLLTPWVGLALASITGPFRFFAQTFGALDINLRDIGCDSYSTSAHKWGMGPLEAGILYVRAERIPQIWPS